MSVVTLKIIHGEHKWELLSWLMVGKWVWHFEKMFAFEALCPFLNYCPMICGGVCAAPFQELVGPSSGYLPAVIEDKLLTKTPLSWAKCFCTLIWDLWCITALEKHLSRKKTSCLLEFRGCSEVTREIERSDLSFPDSKHLLYSSVIEQTWISAKSRDAVLQPTYFNSQWVE